MKTIENIINNKIKFYLSQLVLIGIIILLYVFSYYEADMIIGLTGDLVTSTLLYGLILLIPYFIFIELVKYKLFFNSLKKIKHYNISLLEKEYDYINKSSFRNDDLSNKIVYILVIAAISSGLFFFNIQTKNSELINKAVIEEFSKGNNIFDKKKREEIDKILNVDVQKNIKVIKDNIYFIYTLYIIGYLFFVFMFMFVMHSMRIVYEKNKIAELINKKSLKNKSNIRYKY